MLSKLGVFTNLCRQSIADLPGMCSGISLQFLGPACFSARYFNKLSSSFPHFILGAFLVVAPPLGLGAARELERDELLIIIDGLGRKSWGLGVEI